MSTGLVEVQSQQRGKVNTRAYHQTDCCDDREAAHSNFTSLMPLAEVLEEPNH